MIKTTTNPDAETGTTTALDNLVSEVNSLNEKMEQAIIRVVKENGGFVRTTPDCDTMFGYVYNEEIGRYEERKILALTTEDNELIILFGEEYETLDGMTNDEILESEEWYTVMGGLVFENSTLVYICQTLEEHIDYMLNVEDMDE